MYNKTLSGAKIHDITQIDHSFLRHCETIAKTYDALKASSLDVIDHGLMLEVKKNCSSDKQLDDFFGISEDDVRSKRKSFDIAPSTEQIDTLVAAYPPDTNYLYTTYHGMEDDVESANGGLWFLAVELTVLDLPLNSIGAESVPSEPSLNLE
jgi:hypothetical protein